MPMGQMQKTVKINVTMSEELWPYQVMDEIQKVMEEGLKKYPNGEGWKDSVINHVQSADYHIGEYEAGDISEDHLAHAFTRLMMAMAIERGYLDKKGETDA